MLPILNYFILDTWVSRNLIISMAAPRGFGKTSPLPTRSPPRNIKLTESQKSAGAASARFSKAVFGLGQALLEVPGLGKVWADITDPRT